MSQSVYKGGACAGRPLVTCARVLARMLWLVLLVPAVAAADLLLDEGLYHQLPPLFQLDDYEACLSQRRAAFCLGSFTLSPATTAATTAATTTATAGNHTLFQLIQEFSSDVRNFNHSRLHRGYCLTSRCGNATAPSLRARFETCMRQHTLAQYRLNATLLHLDFCKTAEEPRTRDIDTPDLVFAGVAAAILLINLIGTLYDVCRSKDDKKNKYLMAWSVSQNWKRLTKTVKDGDDDLSALKPIQGMKAFTLQFVIIAHTCFSHYLGYTQNPMFFEKLGRNPFIFIFYNGTVIVQTFIMISSFLLAYNLLLYVDKYPKSQLSLAMLPHCLYFRLVRIVPLYLFVLGLASTWWTHFYDGALWTSIVEREVSRCRHKFWSHALFVNNFYEPDEKCLIQTWFLAVDVQLYILASILTLLLGRWPRTAMKIFGFLFFVSIVGVFGISYNWKLKSVLFLMKPEVIREQLSYEPSFNYMYTAPWGSLPSSFLGLFLAFLNHNLKKSEFEANNYLWLKIMYRLSVPLMFVWTISGYWFETLSSPMIVTLYSTIDRPVFATFAAFTVFGQINKIDELWRKFMSWRGFRILGRMSLSILLLHWSFNLSLVAGRTLPSQSTVLEITGDVLVVTFCTWIFAVPATVLVELPIQNFLVAIIPKHR